MQGLERKIGVQIQAINAYDPESLGCKGRTGGNSSLGLLQTWRIYVVRAFWLGQFWDGFGACVALI